ncbi:hypothetical protein, partial [Streptomyces hainanensis]|uniref:hypothetical protein n=1 Tax=Streptomyces hainanensis TaxID=402648 RepID=UPI001AA00094
MDEGFGEGGGEAVWAAFVAAEGSDGRCFGFGGVDGFLEADGEDGVGAGFYEQPVALFEEESGRLL